MRILQWSLVASLFAVCAGFPLVQAVHEAAEGEMPHVFSAFTRPPTKEGLHRWDENAKDRSIFAKWLRPKTLQLRYDLLGEMNPKAVKGVDGWLFYNQDVDYLLRPPRTDERFYEGTFDTVVAGRRVNLRDPLVAMRDFRSRLEARGIRLVLAPIPGKPSIYPEKVRAGFAGAPRSPTLDLIDLLRGEGFTVVDLFTPLQAAKAAGGEDLYLRRDTHWSPRGMEVAADELAARIRDLGLLALDSGAGTAARYVYADTAVERWGDVAEMTKVPDRRRIWSTETVKARRVVDRAEGHPYRDDPASPILWLGDSYSRIYQTDEPGSAGIIAHVASRLGRPLASIVNDGGASTVVRQQLTRKGELLKGKKIVVWTFVERDLRFGAKGWQLEALPDPVPDETVTKVEGP